MLSTARRPRLTCPPMLVAELTAPPLRQGVCPQGLWCSTSKVWVRTPVGVVTCAALTFRAPGHQATNQPLDTDACTLLPSSRISVAALTPEPVYPSLYEKVWPSR